MSSNLNSSLQLYYTIVVNNLFIIFWNLTMQLTDWTSYDRSQLIFFLK